MKKAILFSLAVSSALLISSCVGLGSGGMAFGPTPSEGAGSLNYMNGCLELNVEHQVEDVVKATAKAFESLKITKTSSSASELCADFEGRTSDDSKVKIVIDAAGPKRSSLSIHVGFFGSEEESMKIYSEIRKHLGDPLPEKK